MSKFGIILMLIIALVSGAYAQSPEPSVLDLKGVFDIVFNFHPVARQADILSDQAKYSLRAARGLFDPSIHSFADRKVFGGTEYFTIWQNELRVPTWLGIDLKAGYEMNQGPFLNRQLTVPGEGLFFAGVSVPIGQGMIIDQRRAILRQAQIFTKVAEAERLMVLNNLLLRVTTDYWDWMFQYNRFGFYQTGLEVATIRYNAVMERIRFGDLAAIDSVEAAIEVQQRRQFMDQARIDYQNSMLRLSNHLWGENDAPLELTENIIPSDSLPGAMPVTLQQLEEMVMQSQENHPLVLTYQNKISQLEVERRYKANLLLPNIRINLNALQHPVNFSSENFSFENYSNNYKIGGSLSFPLLLRRQRNELKLANLYILDAQLELQQKSREISNKIRSVYNEMANFENLMITQERIVTNYNILRDGEETRFRNGESSLFLVNTRERQLIDSQVKLYEFRAKYALSTTKLVWEAGTLAGDN
jgi:outer membrane protein TolC